MFPVVAWSGNAGAIEQPVVGFKSIFKLDLPNSTMFRINQDSPDSFLFCHFRFPFHNNMGTILEKIGKSTF